MFALGTFMVVLSVLLYSYTPSSSSTQTLPTNNIISSQQQQDLIKTNPNDLIKYNSSYITSSNNTTSNIYDNNKISNNMTIEMKVNN